MHYLHSNGSPVVIDWSYFKNNLNFIDEANRLHIGQLVSGWSAPKNSDMFWALGHFTIERDSVDCFLVYDHYDFDWTINDPKTLLYIPEWTQQVRGARPFDVHASGKL
jgi:hypothetical protein